MSDTHAPPPVCVSCHCLSVCLLCLLVPLGLRVSVGGLCDTHLYTDVSIQGKVSLLLLSLLFRLFNYICTYFDFRKDKWLPEEGAKGLVAGRGLVLSVHPVGANGRQTCHKTHL